LVMQNGKAVERGDAEKIFYRHEHPYTAKLLEAIPTGAKPVPANIRHTQPFLKAEHISTHFPVYSGTFVRRAREYVKAVDNVSLQLREGEILGLVGESGSGKSTLGRSIMRLVEINNGFVELNGRAIHKLKSKPLKKARRDFQ